MEIVFVFSYQLFAMDIHFRSIISYNASVITKYIANSASTQACITMQNFEICIISYILFITLYCIL